MSLLNNLGDPKGHIFDAVEQLNEIYHDRAAQYNFLDSQIDEGLKKDFKEFVDNKFSNKMRKFQNYVKWFYSPNGKDLYIAKTFWQKFKLTIRCIFSSSYCKKNVDEAIIRVFQPAVRDYLREIVKLDDADRKKWFRCDSEWLIYPHDVIQRDENLLQFYKVAKREVESKEKELSNQLKRLENVNRIFTFAKYYLVDCEYDVK